MEELVKLGKEAFPSPKREIQVCRDLGHVCSLAGAGQQMSRLWLQMLQW